MKLKVKSSNTIYLGVGSEVILDSESIFLNVFNSDLDLVFRLNNPEIVFNQENPEENKTVISISGFYFIFNKWNHISFVCE